MMTPSVVTLQEVLRHHRTLSRRGREFYESLLAHGDVLAVRLDYLPGAMMWLVTTPSQARLMRKAREGRTTSDVCVMSLADARGKLPMDKLLEMKLDGVSFDHLASVYEEYTGKIAVENPPGTSASDIDW